MFLTRRSCYAHIGTLVRKSVANVDDTVGSQDLVSRLLQLPCGIVRGALANLGLMATVKATFMEERGGASTLPLVSFTIKIRAPGS